MLHIPKWEVRIGTHPLLSKDYEVKINGEDCEVRECRVSAMPYNRVFTGYQRPKNQTELASYITFSADEAATFEIKAKKQFTNAYIKPYSKNVKVDVNDGIIRFTLTQFGQYVLELDDEHLALHIFYNEAKAYPEKENATYYFGPGLHFPKRIELKDNDLIYVDEDAIVYASIEGRNAKNVRIFGGGVLDGGAEDRVVEHCYEPYTTGTIRLYNCENISIEDVVLKDSATWVLSMFDCDTINIDGIKIVGHWRYNTDGIDVCNTSNVTIKNSFVRAFDDVITIKGLYNYQKPIENIVIDNCVLWCGWGRNAEIGVETSAIEYKNITFKNCDLVHSSHVVLSLHNGCEANIHDITYENINVEYNATEMFPVYHHIEEEPYPGVGKPFVPTFIYASNYDHFSLFDGETPSIGNIHDILYKNIHVTIPEGVEKPDVVFASREYGPTFQNFTIDGLYVNGEKQTNFDKFNLTVKNAENIKFK